jgi:16S rRNA (uracil1498-N3)-methyltransferase
MHRFCCPDACRDGDQIRIEGSTAVQIRRVLRLSPGDQVVLFGLDEWEYTVQLERVDRDSAHGRVVCRGASEADPRCKVTLAMALLKGEKSEWVLQKGTELGVSRFLLMQTRRTVPAPDERRRDARWERYARIIREATEQCGRQRSPGVDGLLSFDQALAHPAELVLILHERATTRLTEVLVDGRRSVLDANLSVQHPGTHGVSGPDTLLLVGPEGGFTEDEVALATDRGARPVSLGRRVLRAETAALAAITLAMDAFDH